MSSYIIDLVSPESFCEGLTVLVCKLDPGLFCVFFACSPSNHLGGIFAAATPTSQRAHETGE